MNSMSNKTIKTILMVVVISIELFSEHQGRP